MAELMERCRDMSSILSKQRELLQLAISKTEVSFPSNTLSPGKLGSVGEADKSADLRAENEELRRKIAALGQGGGEGGREEDGQKGSWSVHGNVASRMQQLCALGACSEGDLVAARHLFETCGGKDLFEVANKNGRTCAWLAAREGHVDVLRFLCDVCGSNLLLRVDSQGRSCAWIAAFGGYTNVLQLLKEVVGQDIFMVVDENGTSCAVAAVQGGHVDVARGLRDLCGDGLLLLKDKHGKSCSDLVETVQSHAPDLPPEPEGGGGEMSEFQKALQQLSQAPPKVHDQAQRMLGISDQPLDKVMELVRIINMQCLIRSFLSKRRVARIKKEQAEGPSDFEKAQEELARLPPRFAAEVRSQMQKSDRPLHVIVKWSAIIIAQSVVRGYVVKKRMEKKKLAMLEETKNS